MAIKAGQILHAMNTFVVDRIQTGGPGDLNIPTEKIYEVGNFESVAIVRDVPELSFSLDCLDVDTEIEALLCGSANPAGDPSGSTRYVLSNSVPVDIVSPFKSAIGAFDIVKGVAIPRLTLESASYRYGVQENAGEQFSLRGDSIFYTPGRPHVMKDTGDSIQTVYNFSDGVADRTAAVYNGSLGAQYALAVSVDNVLQRKGVDYTDSATAVTFTVAPGTGAKIQIVFAFSSPSTSMDGTVHQGTTVKPAAIRGKDIELWVDGQKWTDVQSVNVDWRVNLEEDFELGNPYAVSRDAVDVPEVSGSVEVRPRDVTALFDKLHEITGVTAGEVIGPDSSVELDLLIKLKNPASGGTDAVATGTVLKTLEVKGAQFSLPGYEGRANQKFNNTFNFESATGVLNVYKGANFA